MNTVLAILALVAAQQDRGGKIEWRHDLDAALKDARGSWRPLLLYFTADW